MNKKYLLLVALTTLMLMFTSASARAQSATTSVFASGLRSPVKAMFTPKGNLLVAEAGNGPNSGRISIIDSAGNRRTLLDGLPSGFAPPNNAPSGPSGLALRGRTLFVTIGAGDGTVNGPAPGSEVPNSNPSSPFLSAVLSLRLSPQAEETTQGFTMTFADQLALQDRGFLRLTDASGNGLLVEVVINFPNFTEDFPNANVRASNPFGIVVRGSLLYVVDASQNVVYELDTDSGDSRTVIRFSPKPNPLPFGPRLMDAVPNSVHLLGKSLLVTFLTGVPFPAGAAEVRKIRLVNSANEPFISGLTSAIDVLAVEGAHDQLQFFTLEFSTNMLAQPQAPGRLSRVDQPDGAPVVLVDNLTSPTSLARDPLTGNLLVTEIFTGRIMRVQLP